MAGDRKKKEPTIWEKCVRYILNYSAEEQKVSYYGKNGTELLSGESVQDGESITVSPWNIKKLLKKHKI